MKILLAEDEKDMSRAITAILSHNGYTVTAVYDGEAAVEAAQNELYDACVFDIMMPRMDGITALKAIRSNGNMTPVLFLTAKAEVDDRIAGLDAGADDYLTKPFAMGELLARIRSMTRRKESYTPTMLSMGKTYLNTAEQELRCENSIRLARKESVLMEYMLLNKDKVLSKEEIFNHVWKDETESDPGIVWVYISYLKSKLKAVASDITIEGNEEEGFRLAEA
ncbi:MAG: response regulator transcription factor [Eubacterium sp.]|nr:response regulator transcription factor [Eubacterium sp.]